MKALYALLWSILAAITWYEAWLIHKARRLDSTGTALRERQIASTSRATALSLGGILGVNRMLGGRLPEHHVQALLSLALGLNALPAIRFIYLYYRRGWK